ncbi:unnamed protein product [Effrenium voratum]|nr:unnamed protein product [Effrenium voratum]CAJ1439062.1 unnamed protein product [Effrenium voratum]|mmetsp:Transcript_66864/g.159560  ORF Transcript_66864/g.159560 Transcript_66864/m.159560 type:complete len:308 (-) Transcript_66864:48-971(-)|eukprot:CAMPEP_0181428856 /NCGR_PEP_ID=MMETSP1110-20121109/16898_1 /TAXON_ID=174948 /ORGANISM="Symbiodinium sp., Strain CCMP421" /LENGTH=307 /DNA_ID=CAMNT_0023552103 /DNA_START=74 /DNA_END=997 /DNA_ORIENTATION=-
MRLALLLLGCHLARAAFDGNENSLKVLLFWAVDGANRTQETVMRNVAYARRMGGRQCCDVFLAHYEGTSNGWDRDWYASEVTSSIQKPGYKFKFLQEAYREEWTQKYEFVWALDSDIDFTGVNLVELFQLARSSGSLIVGPTFSGDQAWKTYATDLLQQDGARKALMRHDVGQQINVLGKPDPRCMMRHTDFVEMTAPLLSSMVLSLILKDCIDCIHDRAEWGLDRVWCEMASEKFSVSACTLLDATPVRHLDWQTAKVTPEFKDAERKVKERYAKYWAQVRNIDCMLAHKQRRVTIDTHGNIKEED